MGNNHYENLLNILVQPYDEENIAYLEYLGRELDLDNDSYLTRLFIRTRIIYLMEQMSRNVS